MSPWFSELPLGWDMWSVPRFWVFPWFFPNPPTKHILSHRKKHRVETTLPYFMEVENGSLFLFVSGGYFSTSTDGRLRVEAWINGRKVPNSTSLPSILRWKPWWKAKNGSEPWAPWIHQLGLFCEDVGWYFAGFLMLTFTRFFRGLRGGYGYCLKFMIWKHLDTQLDIHLSVDKGGLTKVSPFFVYDPISQADFWNPGQKQKGTDSMAKRADSIQFHEQIFGSLAGESDATSSRLRAYHTLMGI